MSEDLMHECGCECSYKWSLEVYNAEYLATYALAGKMLADALAAADVLRYATVTWQSRNILGEDVGGSIDLDAVQSDGLLQALTRLGLPALIPD